MKLSFYFHCPYISLHFNVEATFLYKKQSKGRHCIVTSSWPFRMGSLWVFSHRIGGVMVCVLASRAVDRGFEPRSGQTEDYKIGICCLSAMHAALRGKSKDWLSRNQNNVSEWSDMSTCRLLFQ